MSLRTLPGEFDIFGAYTAVFIEPLSSKIVNREQLNVARAECDLGS